MNNKVIEYLIAARDMTQAAINSATANAEKYAQTVQKTGKVAQKAGQETASAFNPLGAIFAAASGNVNGMAQQVVGLCGKLKLLNASMVTIGLWTALITLTVKAFNAWNEYLQKCDQNLAAIKKGNFDSFMKNLADEQARYNKELELTNKRLEIQRDHEDKLSNAAKERAMAQLELERQKRIAAGGNRDEINEAYDQRRAEIESSFAGKAAKAQESRLQQDIASLERQIKQQEEAIPDLEASARSSSRRAQHYIQRAKGRFWFNISGMNLDNKLAREANDSAEQARTELQTRQDKIAELRAEITRKQNQIDELHRTDATRKISERASQLSRNTAVADRETAEYEKEQKEIEDQIERTKKEIEAELAERERMMQRVAAEQEKLMQDALRQEENERKAMLEREHRERLANQQAELQAAQQESQNAMNRLQAAQNATATAWGWYRDKDYGSMNAAIDLQKREIEAQRNFDKDFANLKSWFGSDWRTVDFDKLTDDQNAVRQVALAREEEEAARRYAEETAANTAIAADALQELKRIFEEGE